MDATGDRVQDRRSSYARSEGLFYLGDRREGDARAVPWIGPSLPFAAALLNIRIAAGHGLAALAKVAAVIENTSPDRIAAAPAGRSGVIATPDRDNAAGTEPLTSTGIGSVPYLRANEAIARIQAGPDAQAQNYEGQLEKDAAAALNLPLNELISDYSSGSFSNLRMAWTDAQREYADAGAVVASKLSTPHVARNAHDGIRRWCIATHVSRRACNAAARRRGRVRSANRRNPKPKRTARRCWSMPALSIPRPQAAKLAR